MSRILDALRRLEESEDRAGFGAAEIQQQLARDGHVVRTHSVSNELGKLVRAHQIERVKRGRYARPVETNEDS